MDLILFCIIYLGILGLVFAYMFYDNWKLNRRGLIDLDVVISKLENPDAIRAIHKVKSQLPRVENPSLKP